MTTGTSVVRIVLAAVGMALLLGGAALASSGTLALAGPALVMVVGGVVLLVVAILEVNRYQSDAADRQRGEAGPGGGEPSAPEPRFRPTEETFIDPTTNVQMRVYADQRTGERRYVAEP